MERYLFGRVRPYCSACDRAVFEDPKLAVAVVITIGGRILLQRRDIDPGRGAWTFPSGYVDRGEVVEEAAAREVREEAGVEGVLVEKLGDVRYWYQREGRRIFKQVTFFLFDYRAGDTADHDHEIEDARWIPLEEARTALTFEGERDMVDRALSRLRGDQ